MLAYIFATVWAGAFGGLASNSKTSRSRWLFGFASVLVFCLVAGWRDTSVGVDISVYGTSVYNAALNSSLYGLLTGWLADSIEPLFLVLSWVIANTTKDFAACLFVYQFMVVIPVLYGLIMVAPERMGTGLMIYGLVFFPFTLNIIRQSISAAFLLVGLVCLMRSRNWGYVFCCVIAFGFHTTGLMGVVLFPLAALLRWRQEETSKLRRKQIAEAFYICVFAFFAMLVVVLAFGKSALSLLTYIKSSYSYQADYADTGSASLTVLVLGFVFACLYVLATHQNNGQGMAGEMTLVFVVTILGVLLCQLSVLSGQMNRVGMSFLLVAPLTGSLILSNLEKRERFVGCTVLLLVCCLYFWYVYVYGGSGNVVPYSSEIAPFLAGV